MAKKISQREARLLRKRVTELEVQLNRQRNSWSSEWPGGIHIDTLSVQLSEWSVVSTARKLGHAVVLVPAKTPHVYVYATPLPKTP